MRRTRSEFKKHPESYTTFAGNTNPEWVLTLVSDPYGCQMDPTYGLPNNQIGVYSRPVSSANVAFDARNDNLPDPTGGNAANDFNQGLGDIMWDGREPNLDAQFINATLFHGQQDAFPLDLQTNQSSPG